MVPAIDLILQSTVSGAKIRWLERTWLDQEYRSWKGPAKRAGNFEFRKRYRSRLRGLYVRLSEPIPEFPEIIDDFDYFADKWLGDSPGPVLSQFLAALANVDIVLHNGEGHMHENQQPGRRAVFLLYLAKKRLGKLAGEINQTTMVAQAPRPILSEMMRVVYPQLDLVTTRDPRSVDDLRQLGIENAKYVPDVVFALAPPRQAPQRFLRWASENGLAEGEYFCLGGGGLPMSQNLRNDGAPGPLVKLVLDLKKFVPQAVLLGTAGGDQHLRNVADKTGSVYYGMDHEMSEMWPLLSGARFQINGHFHQIMAGAQVGCPFIPLTTDTYKMEALCASLGWRSTRTFNGTNLKVHAQEVVEEARFLAAEGQSLRAGLINACDDLRGRAFETGKMVAEVLTRGVSFG
jgi:polysaccharide pyruvyl transferase WcaK-like protein